jgi:hypothetical protein
MRKLVDRLFGIFRTWESRFALTFVGLVVTVILWGYDHFKEHNPRLKMEVLSRANVIDVKEQVLDLDVIYKSASLRSNHQTLAVVTLRISNEGAASIPLSAYDPSVPLGVAISSKNVPPPPETEMDKRIAAKVAEMTKNTLVVDTGEKLPFSLSVEPAITKAEVISANRNYFLKNVNLHHTPTNAVLNPVIIQSGDWFQIKLLVLHGEGRDFDMSAIGEISDVKIDFSGPNAKEIPPPFWTQVLSGNIAVHLVRLVVYALAMLLTIIAILVGIVLPITAISDSIAKKKRKKLAKKYEESAPEIFRKYSWVSDEYINFGELALITLYKVVAKPSEYVSYVEKYKVWSSNPERRIMITEGNPEEIIIRDHFISIRRLHNLIKKLKDFSLISQVDGKSAVEGEFKTFVVNFATFITGKSEKELDDLHDLPDEQPEPPG